MTNPTKSLRKIILDKTGQDLRKCKGCLDCNIATPKDVDLGFGSLVQLILLNDRDVIGSKLIWDKDAYIKASKACNKQLDLRLVIKALRDIEINEKKIEEFYNQ